MASFGGLNVPRALPNLGLDYRRRQLDAGYQALTRDLLSAIELDNEQNVIDEARGAYETNIIRHLVHGSCCSAPLQVDRQTVGSVDGKRPAMEPMGGHVRRDLGVSHIDGTQQSQQYLVLRLPENR